MKSLTIYVRVLLIFSLSLHSLKVEGAKGIASSQTNVDSLSPSELPLLRDQDGDKRNKTHNDLVINNKGKYNNGGGGGGGFGWGWGWGWGGGGGGGGGGGSGGGGGWGSGCRKQARHRNRMRRNRRQHNHRIHTNKPGEYKVGEFAQCVVEGRCKGMRLDCPLHCGGPCFYDCIHMCKAHCRRP